MYSQLDRDEVLQTLDRLIQRSEVALEEAQDELRQVRSNLVALTIEEHIAGPLSAEAGERKEGATSRFRELQNTADSETDRLQKLRAAREEWANGLPSSLKSRFDALVSGT